MSERPPVVPTVPVGERPPVAARPRSVWANLRDVVIRPVATFRDVAGRPRWVAPLAIVTAGGVGVSIVLWPFLADVLREALLGADAPPGAEAFAMGAALFGALVGPVIGIPLLTLIYAAALWGWARLAGLRGARFEVAMAAVAYIGVIQVLSGAAEAVTLIVSPETLAPGGFIDVTPLGLGMLFDRGEIAVPLHAVLSHVNLFSLWSSTLLAVAAIVALGMLRGWAAGLAGLVWLATGLLRVAGAMLSTLGGPALPGAPVAL